MAILFVYADSVSPGTCRGCQAPMVWAEQTNGKRHPLDGHPSDLVPVKSEEIGGRLVHHIDTTVNTSHFSTCPNANDFRRKKK